MVPFWPFYFRVPLLKPKTKKKGTLTYCNGATQEPSIIKFTEPEALDLGLGAEVQFQLLKAKSGHQHGYQRVSMLRMFARRRRRAAGA